MTNGVTVIIPTLNRGGFLADALRDLVAQRHRPLEILVVDQSEVSPAEVDGLTADHPNLIRHHRVSFRGLPQARNYGWQHAQHDAIVFVDDDIRCGPDLVTEHLRALRIEGVGLVAGGMDEPLQASRQTSRTGQFSRWTATPHAGFAATGEHDVDHGRGANFSIWREALQAAGGVDEALNVGAALYEETDLCLRVKRAGYRIYFNGRARLTHLAAASGGCRVEDVKPYVYAMARNRAVLIRRHLRWYHKPTAHGRLMLLGCSYARHHRSPSVVWDCVTGCVEGLRAGKLPPRCTNCTQNTPA